MRTRKELIPDVRVIYHSELSACPHGESSLIMYNYLAWDKQVQTLDRVLAAASWPKHCPEATCPGHDMKLLAAEGQQLAPVGFGYGYDVLTRIGWLRQERPETYEEIWNELRPRVQISLSHVRYLYRSV